MWSYHLFSQGQGHNMLFLTISLCASMFRTYDRQVLLFAQAHALSLSCVFSTKNIKLPMVFYIPFYWFYQNDIALKQFSYKKSDLFESYILNLHIKCLHTKFLHNNFYRVSLNIEHVFLLFYLCNSLELINIAITVDNYMS